MEGIVIVGYGGHAKSIADSIERENKYQIVGYTDCEDKSAKYKYLGTDDVLESLFENGVHNAAVGIGYLGKGNVRENIYKKLKDIGYMLPVIIDPSAIVSDTAIIGEGAFIGKFAVVNTEVNVGKMSIINTKALVEHECEIGAFVHIAVGATLCGQVKVGEAAFVGANSTVIQCREIFENQIVPAGETVR